MNRKIFLLLIFALLKSSQINSMNVSNEIAHIDETRQYVIIQALLEKIIKFGQPMATMPAAKNKHSGNYKRQKRQLSKDRNKFAYRNTKS